MHDTGARCSFFGLPESSPSKRTRRFAYSTTAVVCRMDDRQVLEEPDWKAGVHVGVLSSSGSPACPRVQVTVRTTSELVDAREEQWSEFQVKMDEEGSWMEEN